MSNLLSNSEVKKLKQVSLSNSTVSRRIAELSSNILSLVVLNIQNLMFNFFAIQLDETTDVANLYVCYIHEGHLEDEFLFCERFDIRTTAKDIFNKINRFFESTISNGSTLLAFALMMLLQCSVVAFVFRLW